MCKKKTPTRPKSKIKKGQKNTNWSSSQRETPIQGGAHQLAPKQKNVYYLSENNR